MSTIEVLRIIEDERRREARRSELEHAARGGRVHRRTIGKRIGRWLQPGRLE